jgi:Fe2+ transport system protein FeoA
MVSDDIEKGFRSEKVVFLSRFPDGLHGTIVDVIADAELQGRLMGMGLFVGTRFQLLRGGGNSNTFIGSLPFLIAIGETRIAVDSVIAEMILVEP